LRFVFEKEKPGREGEILPLDWKISVPEWSGAWTQFFEMMQLHARPRGLSAQLPQTPG